MTVPMTLMVLITYIFYCLSFKNSFSEQYAVLSTFCLLLHPLICWNGYFYNLSIEVHEYINCNNLHLNTISKMCWFSDMSTMDINILITIAFGLIWFSSNILL